VTDLHNTNVLLTGAAGGLGGYIASALATQGAHVTLSDLDATAEELMALRGRIEAAGGGAAVLTADLSVPAERESLVERVEDEIAPVDVLINNAGLEMTSAYTEFTDEELELVTSVNFLAPLILTRHALVGMSRRRRGHVVFMSSMAAKFGSAFNDPYAATKAGLLGLCMSLRREYVGFPVEFSAVCPGFVSKVGMYARMEDEQNVHAPMIVTPEQVTAGVIRAIRHNRPEILLSARSKPPRPVLAIAAVLPRLGERISLAVGTDEVFRTMATARNRIGILKPAANVTPATGEAVTYNGKKSQPQPAARAPRRRKPATAASTT
jgi:short-subunit dehydrogenase